MTYLSKTVQSRIFWILKKAQLVFRKVICIICLEYLEFVGLSSFEELFNEIKLGLFFIVVYQKIPGNWSIFCCFFYLDVWNISICLFVNNNFFLQIKSQKSNICHIFKLIKQYKLLIFYMSKEI